MYVDPFIRTRLPEEIAIDNLVTLHVFQCPPGYVFEGEAHDFWEFVHVQHGSLEVTADRKVFRLTEGEIVFHKPNEFHAFRTDAKTPTKLVIVSFDAKGKHMAFFGNLVLPLGEKCRTILADIVREGRLMFDVCGATSAVSHLRDATKCNQMLKNLLELFLLHIAQADCQDPHQDKAPQGISLSGIRLSNQVAAFLERNIHGRIDIGEISAAFHVSRSYLSRQFRTRTGKSILDYANELKVREAKILLDKGQSVIQVAEAIGCSGLPSFSKVFRKYAGMSPFQYVRKDFLHPGCPVSGFGDPPDDGAALNEHGALA